MINRKVFNPEMKQIPSNIKVLYDAHLKNKAISKSAHFHYRKRLRYYLDFCDKYHLNELKKEHLVQFIEKLKDKKQTAQQQKQASAIPFVIPLKRDQSFVAGQL